MQWKQMSDSESLLSQIFFWISFVWVWFVLVWVLFVVDFFFLNYTSSVEKSTLGLVSKVGILGRGTDSTSVNPAEDAWVLFALPWQTAASTTSRPPGTFSLLKLPWDKEKHCRAGASRADVCGQ